MSTISISHLEAIETVRRLNKELFDAEIQYATMLALAKEKDDKISLDRAPTDFHKTYLDNLKSLLAKAQVLLPECP